MTPPKKYKKKLVMTMGGQLRVVRRGPRVVVIDHKGLVGVPRWKMTRWRQILGWKGAQGYVWFMATLLIPWWYLLQNMENACPVSQMWRRGQSHAPFDESSRTTQITRLHITGSSHHTTCTWVDFNGLNKLKVPNYMTHDSWIGYWISCSSLK